MFYLEVDPGKKILPEREFGNDPLWAVRFGNCRYRNNFFRTDSHVCRRVDGQYSPYVALEYLKCGEEYRSVVE